MIPKTFLNCNGLYAHYEDFQLLLIRTILSLHHFMKRTYVILTPYLITIFSAKKLITRYVHYSLLHTNNTNTYLEALAIRCSFGYDQKISVFYLYICHQTEPYRNRIYKLLLSFNYLHCIVER